MPRVRLAVVILVPGRIGSEIDGLRRGLGDKMLDRVAPHITLVPPVNVNEKNLDAALDVVRGAAAAAQPFQIDLAGATTFAPATPVLYLRVGGALDELHHLRDAVFDGPWARPLTWPFVPHVTLAEDLAEDRLKLLSVALSAYRATFAVTSVHVLREGAGRRWTPVTTAPLGPRRVVGRGSLPLEIVSAAEDPAVTRFLVEHFLGHTDAPPPSESFVISAERSGRMVGAASGHTIGEELWLDYLAVGPATRGEGIGGHLLSAVAATARERDCTHAVTVCPASAGGWYRSHGWVDELALPGWRAGTDYARLRRQL